MVPLTRKSMASTFAVPALALGFLGFAIAFSPSRVGRMVSLDWVIGDMTGAVTTLRVICAMCGATLLLGHRFIARAVEGKFAAYFRGVLLATASMTATTILIEGALRVVQFPYSASWTPSETALARYDGELGWTYRPNVSVTQTFGTDGRDIAMVFDSSGIRVAHAGQTFDANAPSVLWIGCSFTMGHGVLYGETFPARVGERLGVQAVNLGVQAYGTDQSLLMLQRFMSRFNTKVVVYTFIDDHIVRNTNYDRRQLIPSGRWLGSKPLFRLDANGAAVLDKGPRPISELGSLHLLQLAQVAWTRWGPMPDTQLTTALVRKLKAVTADKGVQLLVVDWAWSTADGRYDVGAEAGVDTLRLAVDAPSDWPNWRIPGDGHPTAQAHERAAQLLAARLNSAFPRSHTAESHR